MKAYEIKTLLKYPALLIGRSIYFTADSPEVQEAISTGTIFNLTPNKPYKIIDITAYGNCLPIVVFLDDIGYPIRTGLYQHYYTSAHLGDLTNWELHSVRKGETN